MNLVRTFDTAYVNSILNHPDVFPWVKYGSQQSLDATDIIQDRANFVLANENGCFIFMESGLSSYEVHTNFKRGTSVYPRALEAAEWMFSRTICMRIHTQVPSDNRAASILTRRMGFKHWFMREKAYRRDAAILDVDYFALDIHDWMMFAPAALAEGQKFNAGHETDEAHSRAVGACLLIARHYPDKAVALYNQWAKFAGYEMCSYSENKVYFNNTIAFINEHGRQESPCQQR